MPENHQRDINNSNAVQLFGSNGASSDSSDLPVGRSTTSKKYMKYFGAAAGLVVAGVAAVALNGNDPFSSNGETTNSGYVPTKVNLPEFSWDTLPVFFHSAIGSGMWTDEQAAAIARYPVATFEKNMGYDGNPKGYTEENGPAACRQINDVSQGYTTTLYYLNSAADYWFYSLSLDMEAHPDWRLKDRNGQDIDLFKNFENPNLPPVRLFNMSVPDMRERWINDCLEAVDNGCGGCFIDRANNMGQFGGEPMAYEDSVRYRKDHMETLNELDYRLASKGAFSVANNNAMSTPYRTMTMIEDFAATENCITLLQTVVGRRPSMGALVHSGNLPKGVNICEDGDINSIAAFLIGMGVHSYYHCTPNVWSSSDQWPAVPDYWLDWLPVYDRPVGKPLEYGEQEADGIWRRRFNSGTLAEFDPSTGIGSITWGDNNEVQVGNFRSAIAERAGCGWQTMD